MMASKTTFFHKATVVYSSLRTLCLLIISSIALNSAYADEPPIENNHLFVGVGQVYYSGLYNGLDGFSELDYEIDAKWGALFAEDQTIGIRFVQGDRASLAIAVTRGDDFLEVDEINPAQRDLFLGIEDRDRAIEAGFIYRYRSRVGILTASLFRDIDDTHDATRAIVKFARPITDSDFVQVTPSIFVNYYSSKYNRFYYGVSREENDAGIIEQFGVITDLTRSQFEALRPEYEPGNSGHFGFDVDIKVALGGGLFVSAYGSYEEITGPQFRSPLVEDRKFYTARLRLGYSF